MDYLLIEGLRVETYIGVHAWEKKIKQTLLLDIKIQKNFNQINDKLENTTDYDALCQHVTELVRSKSFSLIETVAKEVITSIQTVFNLDALTIRVSKPHAISHAKNIAVEMSINSA